MKIMLLNKMCKYHKLVLARELIFSSNPKSNRLLIEDIRAMLTSEGDVSGSAELIVMICF